MGARIGQTSPGIGPYDPRVTSRAEYFKQVQKDLIKRFGKLGKTGIKKKKSGLNKEK